ncbi:MarR family winged helix-turn-helix transcriptional regulator [Methylobacterium durans]|uniref:MarR family winged helix-turn-helix transcriptional regulator n=1 Tax=Methylobacterium durans TaxID=2202825 RepID=UPI002AFE9F19|nr:MarR family winged helix-turn-helix transcriptional regulator [Methylobacterium durans]MEA1833857.1 MarR family winged helix-turn-helix transcriptional regulator [Methylobacterium durans]
MRSANGDAMDPSLCSNALLRQAMRSLGQIYDEALAPAGLRATQHGLLANVARMGTPTMGELADALVMDLSGLGHTLKPLTRDGYLRLVPDARDRRARRVILTDLGRSKLGETTALWRGVQERFEAAFGPERAAGLRAVHAVLASRAFRDRVAAGADPADG